MKKNPSPRDVAEIIQASRQKAARRLVDSRNGDVWVWDPDIATHAEMALKLGIPYNKKPGEGDILVI